jgi:hypothetical protein
MPSLVAIGLSRFAVLYRRRRRYQPAFRLSAVPLSEIAAMADNARH